MHLQQMLFENVAPKGAIARNDQLIPFATMLSSCLLQTCQIAHARGKVLNQVSENYAYKS